MYRYVHVKYSRLYIVYALTISTKTKMNRGSSLSLSLSLLIIIIIVGSCIALMSVRFDPPSSQSSLKKEDSLLDLAIFLSLSID